jgi:hypothetical protein
MGENGDPNQAKRGVALLLAASPSLFPLFLILHYGVNFHFWDEWDPEIAGVYIKAHAHQLTIADLLSLHNEHRLLVPRLFHLLLNTFSNWNEITAMLAGWILVCITSWCILCLIQRTVDENAGKFAVPWRWFLCNLLIFSEAQYENWLSGWGLDNALPFFFIAMGIVVATSYLKSGIQLSICLLLASAATFSNGCGFAAWPLLGMLLLWPQSPDKFREKLPLLVVWIFGFALVAGIYFFHYHTQPPENAFEPSIGKFLFYFLAFPANAFADSTPIPWPQICVVIGSIMYALLIANLIHFALALRGKDFDFCRRQLIWFAVGGFSILTAAMGAATRSGFGLGQARISRYVTFSIYLAVALINLLPMLRETRPHIPSPNPLWSRLGKFFAAALPILVLLSVPVSLFQSQVTQGQRLAGKAALMLIDVLPNDFPLTPFVYPHIDRLKQEAHALNEMGYLQPPLIASADAGRIEQDESTQPASAEGAFAQLQQVAPEIYMATGWATSPPNHRTADAVFLTYDDKDGHPIIFQLAALGNTRSPAARQSAPNGADPNGWVSRLDASLLPPDIANARISAWALDTQTGKAILLDNRYFISR